MDQNQPAPVAPNQGGNQTTVAPWLLITFIAVIVIAAGYFGWYYYSQSKAKTATPTPTVTPPIASTTTPTASTVSTADWKTYTSDKYGFSLKYPAKYPVKVEGNNGFCIDGNPLNAATEVFCQDASGMSITVVSNSKNLSLDAFVKDFNTRTQGVTYKYEPVTVNGLTGIKSVQTSVCDGVGCDYGTYYLQNGDNVAIISYSDVTNTTFSTILSTFQFTTAATPATTTTP